MHLRLSICGEKPLRPHQLPGLTLVRDNTVPWHDRRRSSSSPSPSRGLETVHGCSYSLFGIIIIRSRGLVKDHGPQHHPQHHRCHLHFSRSSRLRSLNFLREGRGTRQAYIHTHSHTQSYIHRYVDTHQYCHLPAVYKPLVSLSRFVQQGSAGSSATTPRGIPRQDGHENFCTEIKISS